MRKHAILSASGASRWLACPPSAKLEEELPDKTSVYAEEGTAAHTYAEIMLRTIIGGNDGGDILDAQQFEENNEYYSESMGDYINRYTDFVMEKYNEALSRSKDAKLMLEQRLDFSRWVPDGFGTGDTVIISDGILEIIDLKYGKGVQVESENNSQMKLYALGALNEYDFLYDINEVRMTIHQPRLDHVSTSSLKPEELMAWGNNTVQPIADMAIEGKGEFKAGDHCRFCKIRSTCRARAEKNLELATYEFKEPPTLSVDEIGKVLEKAAELKNWAKDIEKYALKEAEKKGTKFPGWKLVEGRSRRTYTDEDKIADVLKSKRYRVKDIYKPQQLIGITAMQKLLGKKKLGDLIGDYIVKPAGKPTLAPESDKRPELNLVEDEFDYKQK
ncbi:MAG: DUF2800 domain-containing protein [Bacillota bacterium]|nr:DUF2800 domain-containing protein [Bacillota bacterium]